MEYGIAQKKKSKNKAIFDTHSKSKGSSAFDEQKVKNIAIEYRLQSNFLTLLGRRQKWAYELVTLITTLSELNSYKFVERRFVLDFPIFRNSQQTKTD